VSKTLRSIMKHWKHPLPPEDDLGFGVIDLPFDIEAFCRENDHLIALLIEAREAIEKIGGSRWEWIKWPEDWSNEEAGRYHYPDTLDAIQDVARQALARIDAGVEGE
jgi:hypothetical protein